MKLSAPLPASSSFVCELSALAVTVSLPLPASMLLLAEAHEETGRLRSVCNGHYLVVAVAGHDKVAGASDAVEPARQGLSTDTNLIVPAAAGGVDRHNDVVFIALSTDIPPDFVIAAAAHERAGNVWICRYLIVDKDIVARVADQPVTARTAQEEIATTATDEGVVAGEAGDGVVMLRTNEKIVVRSSQNVCQVTCSFP